MAILTVQKASGGISPTFTAAAAAGDKFTTGPRRALLVQNNDASGKTVTIPKSISSAEFSEYGELTISDISVAVAAGDLAVIPIPRVPYSTGGQVTVNYDAVTSVTVAVVELPNF